MEHHIRKISFALAALYACLAVGIPVYQVHCACSGQTQTTVWIEPVTCSEIDVESEHICNDIHQVDHESSNTCSSHCDDTHDCDEGRMHYLLFKSTSEPLIVNNSLNVYPKTIHLDYIVSDVRMLSDRLFSSELHDALSPFFVALAPPLYQSTSEYLSFICQRKVFVA